MAAIRPLLSAGFASGRCRGQKTPPTGTRLRSLIASDPCGSGLGRCGPRASIKAAVGVRRPLPQNPRLRLRIASDPCGSGLDRDTAAAVRGLRSRQLSGSEDPSHRTRFRPQVGRNPCGSGLGRDAAFAIRRLRCRQPSGSRPLPQNPDAGQKKALHDGRASFVRRPPDCAAGSAAYFTRFLYSPVRVSISILSPISQNSGTATS